MLVNPSYIEYNIMTIRASSLFNHYMVKKRAEGNAYICYEMDFSDPRERRSYIKSTESYKDTAMFYQIRSVLQKSGNIEEWTEDSLKRSILFLDFETLFQDLKESDAKSDLDDYSAEDLVPKSKKINLEYRLRCLFRDGIWIKYGHDKVVHYVPFDKSNSMSRQSKISMIDEELFRELNHRLNLDISFDKQRVNLSKYYAYRGLYLSTADRVDCGEKILDSDTVIVIPDASTDTKEQFTITAVPDENEKRKWKLSEPKTEEFHIGEVFDGEGIISPEYSRIINLACHYKKPATSFQIRMPFIKGMLHEVDFHKFIREFAGDVDSFYIIDAFGVKRDLLKAHMVLPVSMVKCKKWLEKEMQDSDESSCMDFYFEKSYEYDHALYISNTNLIYGKSKLTKLNYQFLNTLALETEEFDELVEEHIKWIKNPLGYLWEIDGASEKFDEEDQEEQADWENSREYEGESWKYALKCNPVFAHEYKIKNILKMKSEGLKRDLARGKILVKGEVRYLSRDLLSFLIHLLKEGSVEDSVVESLKKQCMFQDEFFMPNSRLELEITKHYPIFRNPHLSRNEQCVLKPYIKGKEKAKKDLYYRYFSHLSGVMMVSYQSLVPQALGGADFDGDIVKIIDDRRVCNAVLRGTYEHYKRKLPVIVIPSAGGTKLDYVTEKIAFDVIKDTFSNQIGQISNLSIRLGNREYGRGEMLEHSCVECTILTGLEIDAAKTGEHPDFSEIMKYGKEIKEDFDFITDFKEKVEEFSKKGFRISKKQLVEKGGRYQLKKDPYTSETLIDYQYRDTYRNLDKIPEYYMAHLFSEMEWPEMDKKVGGRYLYFDFLENNEWKKKIDVTLQKKIGAVMAAYYRIEKMSSMLYRYRQHIAEGNYEGRVKTILQMQYDYEDYDEIIDDELDKIWEYVDSSFETKEKVESTLDILKNCGWAFLLPSQKKKALAEILHYENEDDIADLLCNFDAQGYNLLFYILKDVWILRAKEMTEQDLLETEIEEDDSFLGSKKVDDNVYHVFYPLLYQEYVVWRDEKNCNWKKKVFERCNREIKKLMEDIEADQRLFLLYSLRGSSSPDRTSLFFGNHVTSEDIRKHIKRNDLC